MPDPGQATAGEWAEYLFFDRNEAGVVIEWWFHNASSYWFLAERNTVTDEVVRTFPPDELFAGRVEFPPPANAGDEDA
jgi:sarcosine oxidase subunit delta